MRLLLAIGINLIFSVTCSMFLGVYLPFDPVNRMFIAGLSVPAIFAAVFVYCIMTERLKIAGSLLSLVTPIMAFFVYQGIAS